MRAFQIAILSMACVVLSGCASSQAVVAATPRTVTVEGTAWNAADSQKAYDLAQAECSKHGRHASLSKAGGSKPNAWWLFDCVL